MCDNDGDGNLPTKTNYCFPNENDKIQILEDSSVNLEEEIDNEEPNFEEFKSGMLFESVDEMFNFYKTYATHKGFPVKRRSSSRDDDGLIKYVTFVCSRSGKIQSTSSNPLKPRPNTRTGCMTRIGGCLDVSGKWRLNSFNLEHNHELSPSKARRFRCNREIISHVKRQLEINDRAGIRVNKNYNSFVVEVGGHENLSFTEKDCRNYIDKARRLRLGEGDAIAIQKYFLRMQAENKGFFFSMDLDNEGRLRNVFWADYRSREAYKEFGEVITFDTTYLTNRYDMPLAPFVGVNNHGKSILLGCGLISSETTETFTWLFETWLACMLECVPSGIITDQDRAMQKAIGIVFPTSRHRWCLWHIMKKVPEKLGGYKKYESISFTLQVVVYDSQTPVEFEQTWSVMLDKYSLYENEWLSGLYNERRRWVPCFVKNSFWAGMSTTQRSESMNTFFDGYVNSKTTLKQFVEQYDNALKSKVEKENQSEFKSFSQMVPCVTFYDMEKQVQAAYTIAKFKEFQNELIKKMYCELNLIREDCLISEYDVQEDMMIGECKKRIIYKVLLHKNEGEVQCTCFMFEFKGILCKHAITVLIRNDILLIPEKYILRRWKKGIMRSHTRVKVNYNGWVLTNEHIRYDKMRSAFNRVADLAVEDEESYASTMELLGNCINDLEAKRASQMGDKQAPKSNAQMVPDNVVDKSMNNIQNILDPVVIRGKGCPPSQRKKTTIFKKKRQNKKKNPTDENVENVTAIQTKKIKEKKRKAPTGKNVQVVMENQENLVMTPTIEIQESIDI